MHSSYVPSQGGVTSHTKCSQKTYGTSPLPLPSELFPKNHHGLQLLRSSSESHHHWRSSRQPSPRISPSSNITVNSLHKQICTCDFFGGAGRDILEDIQLYTFCAHICTIWKFCRLFEIMMIYLMAFAFYCSVLHLTVLVLDCTCIYCTRTLGHLHFTLLVHGCTVLYLTNLHLLLTALAFDGT